MTAKELIEAANYVIEALEPCVDTSPSSESAVCVARHILATVRPDDDEPVTRERLEADGWFRRSIRHRHWESQISVIEKNGEFIAEFENGQKLCSLKSLGHLRRLAAALGE